MKRNEKMGHCHWNGYAYDSPSATKQRTARRDMRCIHCRGLIFKGEPYERWRAYRGFPEHVECPTDPEERARRGCKETR